VDSKGHSCAVFVCLCCIAPVIVCLCCIAPATLVDCNGHSCVIFLAYIRKHLIILLTQACARKGSSESKRISAADSHAEGVCVCVCVRVCTCVCGWVGRGVGGLEGVVRWILCEMLQVRDRKEGGRVSLPEKLLRPGQVRSGPHPPTFLPRLLFHLLLFLPLQVQK